jgi:hypothetical protein
LCLSSEAQWPIHLEGAENCCCHHLTSGQNIRVAMQRRENVLVPEERGTAARIPAHGGGHALMVPSTILSVMIAAYQSAMKKTIFAWRSMRFTSRAGSSAINPSPGLQPPPPTTNAPCDHTTKSKHRTRLSLSAQQSPQWCVRSRKQGRRDRKMVRAP